MKIDSFLSPCSKLKCKWIKDLHIKPGTLKLLEEKIGKTLEQLGVGENFLNKTPMARALRSKIDKWDLMRLQSFFLKLRTMSRKQNGSQQIGKRSLPTPHQMEAKYQSFKNNSIS